MPNGGPTTRGGFLGVRGTGGGFARVDPQTGRVLQWSPGGQMAVGMQVGGGQVRGRENLGAGMFIGPQGAQQYQQWLQQQGYQTAGTGRPHDPLRVTTQAGQPVALGQVRIQGGFDRLAAVEGSAGGALRGGPGGGAPGGGVGAPMMELAQRAIQRKYGTARQRLEEQFHARGMSRSGQYFAALRNLERDEAEELSEAGLRAQLAQQAREDRAQEIARQERMMQQEQYSRAVAAERGRTSGMGEPWRGGGGAAPRPTEAAAAGGGGGLWGQAGQLGREYIASRLRAGGFRGGFLGGGGAPRGTPPPGAPPPAPPPPGAPDYVGPEAGGGDAGPGFTSGQIGELRAAGLLTGGEAGWTREGGRFFPPGTTPMTSGRRAAMGAFGL